MARYRDTVKRLYFRGDAAFANPAIRKLLEAEGIGYTIRMLANRAPRDRGRLCAQALGPAAVSRHLVGSGSRNNASLPSDERADDVDLKREYGIDATALCVLGMHRSGTSAITGALQLLGVDLGERLTPGHRDINALGYFEHREILNHHIELLCDLESHWDDVLPLADGWWDTDVAKRHARSILAILRRDFGSSSFWGVKDPRMCRLMPLWCPLFAQLNAKPCVLIVLRRPDEVAASLARRNNMMAEKAYQVWLENTMAAERWSRVYPRAFITYDALLAEPIAVMETAAPALGISWPIAPVAAQQQLRGFLSPDLHHQKQMACPADSHNPAVTLAFDVWSTLSTSGIAGPDIVTLDALQERHRRRIAGFDPALIAHIKTETARRICYQRRLAGIRRSFSWRITKPLRLFKKR